MSNYSRIVAALVGLAALTACAPPGYQNAAFTAVTWPTSDTPLTIDQRIEIEGRLKALKYLDEPADGVITAVTRNSVRAFQRDIGAPQTGFLSLPLFDALQANTGFLTPEELRAVRQGTIVQPTRNRPTGTAPRAARPQTSAAASGGDGGSSGGGGGGGGGAGAWN